MKSLQSFEDFVNENYKSSVNESSNEMTYLYYNSQRDGESSKPLSPSFYKKVADYFSLGNKYLVDRHRFEDSKGRIWNCEVFVAPGILDLGDDRNHIQNTRYAPDNAYQGEGKPDIQNLKGWDLTDTGMGLPLFVIDGMEVKMTKGPL